MKFYQCYEIVSYLEICKAPLTGLFGAEYSEMRKVGPVNFLEFISQRKLHN